MAKSLIELKTDLKSLKYQGVNGSENPYVTKDIENAETPSRAAQELYSRVDDTVRIAKAILPVNSRFLENQAKLLQASNNQKLNPVKANPDGSFIRRVANTAVSIAGVSASTLAQVPLTGTGTRLGIGFRPTNGSSAIQGEVITVSNDLQEGSLKAKEGKSKLTNVPSNTLVNGLGLEVQNNTNGVQLNQTLSTGSYLLSRVAPVGTTKIVELSNSQANIISKLDTLGSGSAVTTGNKARFDQQTGAVSGSSESFKLVDYNGKLDYTPTPLEVRLKMGNQGHPKKPASYRTILDSAIDKLNQTGPRASKLESNEDPSDLIKFYFTVMTPEEDKYIYFRAYLDSFSDGYQGSWSETQYIGRGEKMQTYDGFSRSVSLSFKIAASTRAEMKPLYQKIVYLASTTAPTYAGTGFMRGTLVKLTVGDYLYETPGVITSVDYKWDTTYPWEAAVEDEEMQQLPHILDCSINFRPIHNFIPQTGLNPFITNTTNKNSNFLAE